MEEQEKTQKSLLAKKSKLNFPDKTTFDHKGKPLRFQNVNTDKILDIENTDVKNNVKKPHAK